MLPYAIWQLDGEVTSGLIIFPPAGSYGAWLFLSVKVLIDLRTLLYNS